jgi:hypothetical protein
MTRRSSSSDGSVVTLTATTVILPFGLQLTRREVTSGGRKISRWRRVRLRSTQSCGHPVNQSTSEGWRPNGIWSSWEQECRQGPCEPVLIGFEQGFSSHSTTRRSTSARRLHPCHLAVSTRRPELPFGQPSLIVAR